MDDAYNVYYIGEIKKYGIEFIIYETDSKTNFIEVQELQKGIYKIVLPSKLADYQKSAWLAYITSKIAMEAETTLIPIIFKNTIMSLVTGIWYTNSNFLTYSEKLEFQYILASIAAETAMRISNEDDYDAERKLQFLKILLTQIKNIDFEKAVSAIPTIEDENAATPLLLLRSVLNSKSPKELQKDASAIYVLSQLFDPEGGSSQSKPLQSGNPSQKSEKNDQHNDANNQNTKGNKNNLNSTKDLLREIKEIAKELQNEWIKEYEGLKKQGLNGIPNMKYPGGGFSKGEFRIEDLESNEYYHMTKRKLKKEIQQLVQWYKTLKNEYAEKPHYEGDLDTNKMLDVALYIYAGIESKFYTVPDYTPPPLNLLIGVDQSGSTFGQEEKIAETAVVFLAFLEEIIKERKGDRVEAVSISSDIKIIKKFDAPFETVSLKPTAEGTTPIEPFCQYIEQANWKHGRRIVVLITDGIFPPEELSSLPELMKKLDFSFIQITVNDRYTLKNGIEALISTDY